MSAVFLAFTASLLIFISSVRHRVSPLVALAAALSFAFAQMFRNTAIHANPIFMVFYSDVAVANGTEMERDSGGLLLVVDYGVGVRTRTWLAR